MPNIFQKYFIIISFFFLSTTQLFSNKAVNYSLIEQADNLFLKKKYTEALQRYEFALNERNTFSKQSLIRMAMIAESQENFPKALHYLHFANTYFPDTRIMLKLQSMGEKYNFSGYEFDEVELLLSIYKQYYNVIIFSLMFLGIPFIFLIYWRKKHATPIGRTPIYFLIILFLVSYVNNFDLTPHQVVISNNTVAHNDSSPAAQTSFFIEAGNRVTIIEEMNGWIKVNYKNKVGYIRNINIYYFKNNFFSNSLF